MAVKSTPPGPREGSSVLNVHLVVVAAAVCLDAEAYSVYPGIPSTSLEAFQHVHRLNAGEEAVTCARLPLVRNSLPPQAAPGSVPENAPDIEEPPSLGDQF